MVTIPIQADHPEKLDQLSIAAAERIGHSFLDGVTGLRRMLDKRILVAGASGDIGNAIATSLVRAGAQLLLVGRHPEKMPRIDDPMSRHIPAFVPVDLTDLSAVEQLAEALRGPKHLDALVLSVGTYHRSAEPEMLRAQLEANVTGPYALVRTLLPYLLRSKGQIVFINSSQALRAAAEVGQYAATKHALKAIADSLREEVNRHESGSPPSILGARPEAGNARYLPWRDERIDRSL